jgi:hypothetical protein
MQKSQPPQDVSELWIQHQRRNNKTTPAWACIFCEDRRIFSTESDLTAHAKVDHSERLPTQDAELEAFLQSYVAESAHKRSVPLKGYSTPQPCGGTSKLFWDLD